MYLYDITRHKKETGNPPFLLFILGIIGIVRRNAPCLYGFTWKFED